MTWDKTRRKWRAQVKHNRKNHLIGRYDAFEDAVAAAEEMRHHLFTHNQGPVS